MAESLVTKEEEKRLLTTYSPLSHRCYQGFSSTLPALKAGRKNFTGMITPCNFPPSSLKVCLIQGSPKQFSSALVIILLPLAIWTTFQLARTCTMQHTQMSLQRRQNISPHICSVAVVVGFPREPSTWLLCNPDSKLCLPWHFESALNGWWAIPIADCNLHWINEADTLFNEWNTFPFIIVAQTKKKWGRREF